MAAKNILIVDDSEFDREVLCAAIRHKGYTATAVSSGDECLAFLRANKTDLILLDLVLGSELGSDLLVKIRAISNQIELPVIMVSSKTAVGDIVECLQAGANDYVTKPINFDLAFTRIEIQLRLGELSTKMSDFKELQSSSDLIATYSHEINNPLAIALGYLERADLNDADAREKITKALWRIAEIVKQISAVQEQKRKLINGGRV